MGVKGYFIFKTVDGGLRLGTWRLYEHLEEAYRIAAREYDGHSYPSLSFEQMAQFIRLTPFVCVFGSERGGRFEAIYIGAVYEMTLSV